ncbi:MAG: hypothetical protein OEY14_01900 [Myxococcales bacterium]|nr:hypothetical protein [Myxococcales bacterium]
MRIDSHEVAPWRTNAELARALQASHGLSESDALRAARTLSEACAEEVGGTPTEAPEGAAFASIVRIVCERTGLARGRAAALAADALPGLLVRLRAPIKASELEALPSAGDSIVAEAAEAL